MGISYSAVVFYGAKKDFPNDEYDPDDEYPDLESIILGYDSCDAGFIVGQEIHDVDDPDEPEILNKLSKDKEKEIEEKVGEPCQYYVTLYIC